MTEGFQLDGMERAGKSWVLGSPRTSNQAFFSSQASLPHSFYQSAFQTVFRAVLVSALQLSDCRSASTKTALVSVPRAETPLSAGKSKQSCWNNFHGSFIPRAVRSRVWQLLQGIMNMSVLRMIHNAPLQPSCASGTTCCPFHSNFCKLPLPQHVPPGFWHDPSPTESSNEMGTSWQRFWVYKALHNICFTDLL